MVADGMAPCVARSSAPMMLDYAKIGRPQSTMNRISTPCITSSKISQGQYHGC